MLNNVFFASFFQKTKSKIFFSLSSSLALVQQRLRRLVHAVFGEILHQPLEERVFFPDAVGVADEADVPPRPRHRDVHPPRVGEEADVARFVRPRRADDDGLLLPPLEPVDGRDFYGRDLGRVRVGRLGPLRELRAELPEQGHLGRVGRDDADVAALCSGPQEALDVRHGHDGLPGVGGGVGRRGEVSGRAAPSAGGAPALDLVAAAARGVEEEQRRENVFVVAVLACTFSSSSAASPFFFFPLRDQVAERVLRHGLVGPQPSAVELLRGPVGDQPVHAVLGRQHRGG